MMEGLLVIQATSQPFPLGVAVLKCGLEAAKL